MKSRVMRAGLCVFDKLPMAGDSHSNSLIHGDFLAFGGGSRAILSDLLPNRYVAAVHELCDTTKLRHIVACLKLVDDLIECRLGETSRGPPGVLEYQAFFRLRVRIVLLRSTKHPCPATLQRRRLPDRKVVRVVCVLPDFNFEARVTCDRAEVPEGGDSRIKSQIIGVHITGRTTDNTNECLKIGRVLKVVILRDHSAGTVEETDVEDSPANGDVEGVTHERARGKVETRNIRDLTKDRFHFRRGFSTFGLPFVALAWRLRELPRDSALVMSDSEKREDIRHPEGLVSCLPRPSPQYKGSCDVHMGGTEHFHQQGRQ
jgi:hypothetical protein